MFSPILAELGFGEVASGDEVGLREAVVAVSRPLVAFEGTSFMRTTVLARIVKVTLLFLPNEKVILSFIGPNGRLLSKLKLKRVPVEPCLGCHTHIT